MEVSTPLHVLANAISNGEPQRAEITSSLKENSLKRSAPEDILSPVPKVPRNDVEKGLESEIQVNSNASPSSDGSAIADQLRLSIKLKEQQEALIYSRRVSATQQSPNNSQNNPPKSAQPHSPIRARSNSFFGFSTTPRSPIGRREELDNGLKIRTESNYNSGNSFSKPMVPQSRIIQPPLLSPSVHGFQRRSQNSPVNRTQLLNFFESVFESYERTDHLCMILNEQIQHSQSMMNSLKSSGNVIENLVAKHFKEMQSKMNEKYALALTDLNRRLKVIEEKLDISPLSARSSPSPKSESVGVRQIGQLVNK